MAERILVATDRSGTGNRAVVAAASLGHDLCIVHVLMHGRATEEWMRMAETEHLSTHVAQQTGGSAGEVPSSFGDYFARTENETKTALVVSIVGDEILERGKAHATELGARNVSTRSCLGEYADRVLDVAEEEKSGMIVPGSRGLGRMGGVLLGSVSQEVLYHAKPTVVVVC